MSRNDEAQMTKSQPNPTQEAPTAGAVRNFSFLSHSSVIRL